MHKTRQRIVFVSLVGSCIIFFAVQAMGGMKIHLNNGQVVEVPVNKEDIVSITFEGGQGALSPLNWNFETGDLRGWTKTGTAFDFQPTYGDNPTARNRGQPSRHQGDYWIGGYEKRPSPSDPPGVIQGDQPQGTLTSRAFQLTRPSISFLLGGGCDINTERVELLADGIVVLKATGKCTETMERINWNASQYLGREVQIRLVDFSGGGWGHINFDDVIFN